MKLWFLLAAVACMFILDLPILGIFLIIAGSLMLRSSFDPKNAALNEIEISISEYKSLLKWIRKYPCLKESVLFYTARDTVKNRTIVTKYGFKKIKSEKKTLVNSNKESLRSDLIKAIETELNNVSDKG